MTTLTTTVESAASLTLSPVSGRWNSAMSEQGASIDQARTPGLESCDSRTTLDVQSEFGRMDIEQDDTEDSVFHSSARLNYRAASVDTGLPDRNAALTKRKLDDFNRTVKDDMSIGSRSRQSSAPQNEPVMRTAGLYQASSSSPRRKTLKRENSSNGLDSYCESDESDHNSNDIQQQLPLFRTEEVWVTSQRAQLQWLVVANERHKRLLLRLDAHTAIDADFGVMVAQVPLLLPTYDANGAKIYVRQPMKEVSIYAARLSSDAHPLFHNPRNVQKHRSAYETLARLPDHFSWIEDILAIGGVQLRLALLLQAGAFLLRPVCDHPVYCQYFRPAEAIVENPLVPISDDQNQPLFSDVRVRQLLGVFHPQSFKLLFLLDCLDNTPSHLLQSQNPSVNILAALLRGQAVRPQLQGEVYRARLLKLDLTSKQWVTSIHSNNTTRNEVEEVCLKVSRLNISVSQLNHTMNNSSNNTNIDNPSHMDIVSNAAALASDVRLFVPMLTHPLLSEQPVQDILAMQFFQNQRLRGFLRPRCVAFDAAHLYCATDFQSKGTLYDLFRQRRRPFSIRDTQRVMRFLVRQVAVMHSAGLSHGDLFPDNLLLCDAPTNVSNTFIGSECGWDSVLQQSDFLLMDFGQSRSTVDPHPSTPSSSTSNLAGMVTNDSGNHSHSNSHHNSHNGSSNNLFQTLFAGSELTPRSDTTTSASATSNNSNSGKSHQSIPSNGSSNKLSHTSTDSNNSSHIAINANTATGTAAPQLSQPATTPGFASLAGPGPASNGSSRVPHPQGKFVCFTPESIACHSLRHDPNLAARLTNLPSLSLLGRRELQEKADAWQLGVFMFMLLTGREPFSAQPSNHNNNNNNNRCNPNNSNKNNNDTQNPTQMHTQAQNQRDIQRQQQLINWLLCIAREQSSHYQNSFHSSGSNNNSYTFSGPLSPASGSTSTNATPSYAAATAPSLLNLIHSERSTIKQRLRHNQNVAQTHSKHMDSETTTEADMLEQQQEQLQQLERAAWSLLTKLLHCDPRQRSSLDSLLNHEFLRTNNNDTSNNKHNSGSSNSSTYASTDHNSTYHHHNNSSTGSHLCHNQSQPHQSHPPLRVQRIQLTPRNTQNTRNQQQHNQQHLPMSAPMIPPCDVEVLNQREAGLNQQSHGQILASTDFDDLLLDSDSDDDSDV